MESSKPCQNCGKRTLITDDVSGNLVCSSCSVVQEFDNYQAHFGGLTGPTGTFVRAGTVGSGTVYCYRETKIYDAHKLIADLMLRLGFSVSRSDEVKAMVETITEGEYGRGDWFPVFVGACAYVVMRKDNKMLPIVEVAAAIGCDIHELGRMINRVLDFLVLKLPEFDIVNSFERVIKVSSRFSDLPGDKLGKMLKQGVFLLQCLVKWFLTTGRRPMPVVVAVLVFVAELNEVSLNIEDMAMDLHVAVATCRLRYKELLKKLVKVAQALPWGKDVTVKNILKNAPFVMQYMELKSMAQHGDNKKSMSDVGFGLDDLIDDCLNTEDEYGFYNYGSKNDSKLQHPRTENSENLKLSHECLSMVYSKYLDEISKRSRTVSGDSNRRKRKRSYDLRACTEWWKGKSELSKKLLLKQILEKDIGLDASPPSFDKGCLRYQTRREKIKAAKLRIEKIMHPLSVPPVEENDVRPSEHVNETKQRRKTRAAIDSEDLVIETLLLHKLDEEEIEKGYYNTLLDLHVFNSGM